MNTLVVDGVALPSPNSISIRYEHIGEMDRMVDGSMVADIIAKKTHIRCNFNFLVDDLLNIILHASRPILVQVMYKNPENNQTIFSNMFAKISPGINSFSKNGKRWWKDVECVFIEE